MYAHEHLQMAIEGAIRSPISVMTTPQDTPTDDYRTPPPSLSSRQVINYYWHN